MHIATQSMTYRAGHEGLKAHRFCMPSTGGTSDSIAGRWYNQSNGRRFVAVAACEKDVEPGEPFRAIMPEQVIRIEMTQAGEAGDHVTALADGRGFPREIANTGPVVGFLLEDVEAGEVASMFFGRVVPVQSA